MNNPARKPPDKITQLWAVISTDENGDEGLCATYVNGAWIPLIAADEARLKSTIAAGNMVAGIIKRTGIKEAVRLVKFSCMTEIQVLYAGPEPAEKSITA